MVFLALGALTHSLPGECSLNLYKCPFVPVFVVEQLCDSLSPLRILTISSNTTCLFHHQLPPLSLQNDRPKSPCLSSRRNGHRRAGVRTLSICSPLPALILFRSNFIESYLSPCCLFACLLPLSLPSTHPGLQVGYPRTSPCLPSRVPSSCFYIEQGHCHVQWYDPYGTLLRRDLRRSRAAKEHFRATGPHRPRHSGLVRPSASGLHDDLQLAPLCPLSGICANKGRHIVPLMLGRIESYGLCCRSITIPLPGGPRTSGPPYPGRPGLMSDRNSAMRGC